MTQLERLLYLQGQLCFFCQKAIPAGEASIEHLHASSKGGGNGDDNCVACCQTLNTILGSMSVKEKLRVVVNQKGRFKCPKSTVKKPSKRVKSIAVTAPSKEVLRITDSRTSDPLFVSPHDKLGPVIKYLVKQVTGLPRKLAALKNTLNSQFKKTLTPTERTEVLEHLKLLGYIVVENGKITYALPELPREEQEEEDPVPF